VATTRRTAEESDGASRRGRPVPGVVIVHAGMRPALAAVALRRGKVVLGRETPELAGVPDDRISREHVAIELEGDAWRVRDLGSTNGTFVDGERLEGTSARPAPRVIRIGHTIALPAADVRPFVDLATLEHGAMIAGPSTRRALAELGRAAAEFPSVLITGASGTGKELAAAAFHAAGPNARGPLVAMNCAALPEAIAERLLFGAQRGAYTGAEATTEGYLQAADGGVVFLDEIGELAPALQAKLLRVIETREVAMLGATRARKVDVRYCFATHRDLRRDAADGRFREDLYYRIGRPEIRLAPLRDRPEEIPWLIGRATALPVHPRFVEACLLRPWPGNVRELVREVALAAAAATAERAEHLGGSHLAPTAGHALDAAAPVPALDRAAIERALAAADGNAAAAARALGVHRPQLYRLMKRFGIR
jgi:DNA-binding NtrC family response regulator